MPGSHVMFSFTTTDQLVQATASCFRNQSVLQQINHRFIPTFSLSKQIIYHLHRKHGRGKYCHHIMLQNGFMTLIFLTRPTFSNTASKLIWRFSSFLYRILNDTQASTHEKHKRVVLNKQECIPIR